MMVNELHRSEKCGWRQFGVAESCKGSNAASDEIRRTCRSSTLMDDGNKQKLMWMSRCQIE
jgi:hypothetical protein